MQGRGQEMAEIIRLLLQQSLAEWQPSLEESSGKDGSVMNDLYSKSKFKPMQRPSLRVSRYLKSCLT